MQAEDRRPGTSTTREKNLPSGALSPSHSADSAGVLALGFVAVAAVAVAAFLWSVYGSDRVHEVKT